MGVICAAALLVSAAIRPHAAAQDGADYGHLVDTYARGQLDDAVAALARWPRENVTAAVHGITLTSQNGPGGPSRLRAAAMLHTDLAAAFSSSDGRLSEFHFGLARNLVGLVAAKKEQIRGAQEFVQRWYEFAPTLYLATRELDKASTLVREGILRSPASPLLYVYGGEINELLRAVPSLVVTRARGFGTVQGPLVSLLDAAAAEHRRALAMDSHLAIARLHLGWIHFQQQDSRARGELEAALADASDTATTYLAHLFLGATAERENHLADALAQYEKARTIGPHYQTAYIAVIRMAEALGDTERARQTALTFVATEKREDPWWDYHLGGLNMPVLEWLRAAVRTQ
jgi:tetratricopeptide (TPR) repeat protein